MTVPVTCGTTNWAALLTFKLHCTHHTSGMRGFLISFRGKDREDAAAETVHMLEVKCVLNSELLKRVSCCLPVKVKPQMVMTTHIAFKVHPLVLTRTRPPTVLHAAGLCV